VPAKFNIAQKQATMNAGKLAGFDLVVLVEEPVAACLAYNMEAQNKKGTWLGCGTTFLVIIIVDNQLFWLSVGDSKLYISREKEMSSVVREHNYRLRLNQLLSQRKIDKEEYDAENKRGDQLISYLGIGNLKIFDVSMNPFQLQKNDRIFLCSDGIYKTMKEEKLKELISGNCSINLVAEHIINEIKNINKKNQDNASFVLIEILEES
jgi:protein phosphatase